MRLRRRLLVSSLCIAISCAAPNSEPSDEFTADEFLQMLEVRSHALAQRRQDNHLSQLRTDEWLAAVHAGNAASDPAIRARFRTAMGSVADACPEEPTHLGDLLAACKLELESRGFTISLLSLTEGVADLLTDPQKKQENAIRSCREAIVVMCLVEIQTPFGGVSGGPE